MKKSDIVEIAVKILGLYLFIMVFQSIVELSSAILMITTFSYDSKDAESWKNILILLSVFKLVLLTSFAILLTFGSATVTKKICRKEDFNSDASLIADKKTMIEIALIIIGGLLFTNELPAFTQALYTQISLVQQHIPAPETNESFLYVSFAKIVLGLILIFYSKLFSLWLSKGKKPIKAE